VKPTRFDYVQAETVAEVHSVLAAEGPNARVLAGGQSLVPMLSMRLAKPRTVIDIMRIPGFANISEERKAIRVGAAVCQEELLEWADRSKSQPLLEMILPWVGHAQTRSRGTVCGSAAHADPSAEIPLALFALKGEIELSSHRKKRRAKAEEFFTGLMSTACADDELIEAVLFPVKREGEGFAFREFGRRKGDFAIVACAAVASGKTVRLAIGGVADKPMAREFSLFDSSALDDALDTFAWDLEARDDLHATASYRRALVRRLGRETIEEARQWRA